MQHETNVGHGEGASGEPVQGELKPLIWQEHVHEEMERLAREHKPAPPLSHFAEEYAERAMRGVEVTPNEYQHAAERGETRGATDVPNQVADAGDIAGGTQSVVHAVASGRAAAE